MDDLSPPDKSKSSPHLLMKPNNCLYWVLAAVKHSSLGLVLKKVAAALPSVSSFGELQGKRCLVIISPLSKVHWISRKWMLFVFGQIRSYFLCRFVLLYLNLCLCRLLSEAETHVGSETMPVSMWSAKINRAARRGRGGCVVSGWKGSKQVKYKGVRGTKCYKQQRGF